MEQNTPKLSLGQRWSEARPTKTIVFWSCVASAVVTMIVGFSWGGWTLGSTVEKVAMERADSTVVAVLAPNRQFRKS